MIAKAGASRENKIQKDKRKFQAHDFPKPNPIVLKSHIVIRIQYPRHAAH
jgi:hypothetical protein